MSTTWTSSYPVQIQLGATWTSNKNSAYMEYVFCFGKITFNSFGVWTKDMDDLLYDQQAFGL